MTADLRPQKPTSGRTLTPETEFPDRLGFNAVSEWAMIVFAFVICPGYPNPHRIALVSEPDSPPAGGVGLQ